MYSKGISWINDCRIPYVDTNEYQKRDAYKEQTIYGNGKGMPLVYWETNTQGRFPANILVSDDMLNDGSISKGGRMVNISNPYDFYEGTEKTYKIQKSQDINDKGTNSRYYDIDKWFDNLLE